MAVPTWVTEAGVFGTWAVGLLALFGDRIRAWCFKPKLELTLKSRIGSLCPQDLYDEKGIKTGTTTARYYHLRVINRRSFPLANEVQILIIGVERTDTEDRRPSDLYVPLPLGWVNGLHPLARKIGSTTPGDADLLFVREGMLEFRPVVVPKNFQARYFNMAHLRVTAIARSIEVESEPLRLQIDWDGVWDADDEAMTKHFNIRPA
jgi:hypothetical protein